MTISNVRTEKREITHLDKRVRGCRALPQVIRPESGWQVTLGPNAWMSLVPLEWLKASRELDLTQSNPSLIQAS
jgi:hypothetical protein